MNERSKITLFHTKWLFSQKLRSNFFSNSHMRLPCILAIYCKELYTVDSLERSLIGVKVGEGSGKKKLMSPNAPIFGQKCVLTL